MKTIYRSIVFLCCLFIFNSCNDFLELNPKTVISENEFYESKEDFNQALVGAYLPLQTLYRTDWIVSEMRSDHTHFIYNLAQRGPKPDEDISTFTVSSNNRNMASKWDADYQIIARTNKLIENINGKNFEPEYMNRIIGECLFLRAFSYFDLVKNFADVPLFLESANSYESSFKERESKDIVIAQIIKDLTESRKLLKPFTDQPSNKASFGSASTLLAYVFITEKKWNDAELLLKEVKTLGYGLESDYREIFNPNNEVNKEMIFEVDYLDGTGRGTGNDLPYQFIPDLTNPGLITGITSSRRSSGAGFNIPTPDLLILYDKVKDKRYAASVGTFTGESPIQGVPYNKMPYIRKYLFPHAMCCETGQNFPIFRYAEVLLLLSESLNEQGKTAQAIQDINLVRNRAGLALVPVTGQSQLREIIYKERQLELAFENKRWHDLVRTGRAVQVMNVFGAKVKANPTKYYYPVGISPTNNSFMVTQDFLIYPIPITEININPKLTQNKGY